MSLVAQPISVTKALLPIAVPFADLIGIGIQTLWAFRRTVVITAILALTLISGLGVWKYTTNENVVEPWRDVATLIASSHQESDVILVLPNFVEFPLRYYMAGTPQTSYSIKSVPRPYPECRRIGPHAFQNIDLEPWFRESQGVWLVILNRPNSTRDDATLE